MHQTFADGQDAYNSDKILGAIEDTIWCRRFKKLPMHERPAAYSEWFLKKHGENFNDVWEYRQPPVDLTEGRNR